MASETHSTTKLVSPSPQAEVLGAGLMVVKNSLHFESFAHKLAEYGFDDIDPDKWYPLQLQLDMYEDMITNSPGNAMQNLISIGMTAVELMPDTCEGITGAVELLNVTAHQMLRGFDVAQYSYDVEIMGAKHIQIVDYTPFPHDLIYGYLYAIARRFGPKGSYPIVERTLLNKADPNSAGAVYTITW